jgi:DNA (cytosine-5)-methyltransferase 1
MKLKEKISLEKVFEKEYKDKLVEPKNNKEAVITHFLHNSKNGVSLRKNFSNDFKYFEN